tara:strand:- start:2409 stop:3296 length:888 start_codon:yes stop_codon:yes gene_type:complete
MKIKIQDLLKDIIYIKYSGPKNQIIDKLVSLNEINGTSQAICWCSEKNSKILSKINTSSIVIVNSNINEDLLKNVNYLMVEKPRLIFQQILTKYFVSPRLSNISSSSIISSDCSIGKNAFIGHNVIIEKGCTIGNDVVIMHNSVIMENTIIGNNVNIGCNSTIGGTGFGYEKNLEEEYELIPHIGNVIIRNNVDIGNNTCVDRAVLGSTLINENVKIDNHVHIAHNAAIGKNSIVTAGTVISGSVKVGESCWLGPNSTINNKVSMADFSTLGIGSVLLKTKINKGTYFGIPAKKI